MELGTIQMVQPTRGDGFLGVARELIPGVEALAPLNTLPARSCAMLAGHALECVLKAYLWHMDNTRRDLGDHDLLTLWGNAYAGLGLQKDPPSWVSILATGHGPDFYLRYQKGKHGVIVHGGSTPAPIPMAAALRELLVTVEAAIKN